MKFFNPSYTLSVTLLLLSLLTIHQKSIAQTATVQGIITDSYTSEPLTVASIALRALPFEEGDPIQGQGADLNGFYQITGLQPGTYGLTISFIGYASHTDTLTLNSGETRTISLTLEQDDAQLDDVFVTPPGAGAAGISAGRQRVEAADFARVPTPAGGGDLASYLQTLPGVVTTGDRGGQLYIRGGTPAQNMVLVDGTLIFQPFHILGFFSAFPEDLVSSADFYAGGFGARYSGRISSVIDVRMRNGNRYETDGKASVGPFLGEVLIEGPLTTNSSFIASARRSLVEETSGKLLGREYPLRFESQYFKVSHFGETDTQCSMMGLRTYDRGRLDAEQDDVVNWKNFVVGGRCVILPEGSDMLFDMNAGISSISNATGESNDPELFSDALRINLDVNITRFSNNIRFDYGAFVHVHNLKFDMSELFGGPQANEEHLLSTGAYVETLLPFGNLDLTPGVVFSFHKDTYPPSIDPRVRLAWQPWGREEEQLSAAFGLYRQPLAGVTGTRDAGSIFTAWMSSPTNGDQIRATHALLGWRQTLGAGFQISVEAYRKWMQNIPVPVWSNLVQFTTELAVADGDVYGSDIRIEYNRGPLYGFIGYGFSQTSYESEQSHFNNWFGESTQTYSPPHDRQHQVNGMFSMELGNYTAGIRWQFGSGLPFTRPMGFDELLRFREKLPNVKEEYGTPRVILERLYQGRMPIYHRLDFSLERTFTLGESELKLQLGAINMYDRTNIFYYDVYTHRRVDQLGFAPYVSLTYDVR